MNAIKEIIRLAIVGTMVLTSASVANAASLILSAYVDAAYNNGIDFVPVPYNPTLAPATTGVVYEIPIYFQISDLQPGEDGFGGVDFSVTTTDGLTIDSDCPYYGEPTTFDAPQGSVPYFFINQEVGGSLNTSTYGRILASPPAHITSPTDPRYTMGLNEPFLLGYLYVDCIGAGTVTITPVAIGTNDGGLLAAHYDDPMQGVRIHFSDDVAASLPIPEPADSALLAFGFLSLIRRSGVRG
ncbi:MAG TPA: hypothetical protein VG722_04535 [Tepidisphaeraceae bacterium]|nr:hypothetical protein [Tepidisphaeraceae bacterium]